MGDNKYFENISSDQEFVVTRNKIVNNLEEYVSERYGARTKTENILSEALQFEIDVRNKGELQQVVNEIQSLISSECPVNCDLYWAYVPTNKYGQKTEWKHGSRNTIDHTTIQEHQYPIKRFRIAILKPDENTDK